VTLVNKMGALFAERRPAHSLPQALYLDPAVHDFDIQAIFQRQWIQAGLEAEIPRAGDYLTHTIGTTSVVVLRNQDGEIGALFNTCRHRGAQICRGRHGHARRLVCPYHQWTYDLRGKLLQVARMPEDFDVKNHRLQKLRVETFCGMIFGTFSEETPPIETYVGPAMAPFIQRNLGRPLKVLGTHSQIIRNNWKLYAENLRDSYHATLLHTFYTSFKVNRLDMDGGVTLADKGWHHISFARHDRSPDPCPGSLARYAVTTRNLTHAAKRAYPQARFPPVTSGMADRPPSHLDHAVPGQPGQERHKLIPDHRQPGAIVDCRRPGRPFSINHAARAQRP